MKYLKAKAVSSLKKVMLTDNFYELTPLTSIKAAKGERVSFQIALKNTHSRKLYTYFKVCDEFKKFTHVAKVGYTPVRMPSYRDSDKNYLSLEPGLYPDVLYPIDENSRVVADIDNTVCVWFTIDLPKTIKAGKHTISVEITNEKDEEPGIISIGLEVKKTVIAPTDLIYTQWFHCDCIADYFGVPMMSKKHWTYIENFIKTAARTGINMLLTPIFTPPLDTDIGGERPTMQLVKVAKQGDKYSFDFTLFDKWVKICHKHGIKYFEISHLFTQWGACFCPKIIVNVDGQDEMLFGWHVESTSKEYKDFLSQFLPEFTAHIKNLGIADACYFHISDEPKMKEGKPDYDNFVKINEFITPLLSGFKKIDALSQAEFYDSGLVQIPIPCTNHIEPFLERDLPERWCYYCCSQYKDVSNRFLAMSSARTRVIGAQMFYYDMVGFLQWGYNFYYSERSRYKMDPFQSADGDNSWPAGDPFSVYPYEDGAIESIRSVVFYDALQDRMLLKALADKIGADEAKALLLEMAGGTFTFSEYPMDAEFITNLHDKVLDILG